jgi:hypothetical protein
MNPSATAPTPDSVDPQDLDRLAFDDTAPDRAAREVEDCRRYTLDAFFAAGRALWILPRVMPYRQRMLALPDYDLRHLDRFERYARALRFVETAILLRVRRTGQLPELAAEGWRLRALMMSYAEALSHKGRVAPELIVRLREGSGYRTLVEDLTVLVHELLAVEGGTGPGSPVTLEDLDRAAEIADELNVRVGNPAEIDATRATLVRERRKLGHLLVEAHDQLRRALGYLRWAEGDANTLVPSLYVLGRKRRTRVAGGRSLVAE